MSGGDGDLDDGIDAFVSIGARGHELIVKLTSTEDDESVRRTDTFRVTVERIDP